MRVLTGLVLGLAMAACGNVHNPGADGASGGDGPPGTVDAHPGPDGPCVDTRIFTGGMDPVAQGWTVEQSGFATLTVVDPNTTELATDSGGITGGAYLLLARPGLITPGRPFAIEVEMMVTRVDPHQGFNAAVVLAGSYSGYPGTMAERRQLVYVDSGAFGWSDDSQTAAVNAIDNQFHTYRFAVDAGGAATVTRDGAATGLTRPSLATNGTFAIGDVTDQIFIESAIQIRSVTKLCP